MRQLDSIYEDRLGKKLAAIEEVRTQLGNEGINCPGVLVVGAQSAGKSSVLERLTGISFPRGESLCTRYPTIVQLQTNANQIDPVAYVSIDPEFKDSPQLRSMEKIKEKILECTFQLKSERSENGATVANIPIHVRYIRNNGPVMTLIDLPGITHVDAKNENFDIHSATVEIVDKYVQNENMVVLVVIPANDDFGNSEALRIAQKYDLKGDRTIGVISKCDLVPRNSDVVQKIRMVRDIDVKLTLGFIAVRNKAPDEENIDINELEKTLFTTHNVLNKLHPDEWGYDTLSRKIVDLQTSKVDQFIPEVRLNIKKKLIDAERELRKLGDLPSTRGERQTKFSSILVELQRNIEKMVRAEGSDSETKIATNTWRYAQQFALEVREGIPDFLSDEYHEHIIGLMKNSSGYTLPNFISDTMLREEIGLYFFKNNIIDRVQEFIEDVASLMTVVFERGLQRISSLNSFPMLRDQINDECSKKVQTAKDCAIDTTNVIVHAESVQLFTQNLDYTLSMNGAKESIRKFQSQEVWKDTISDLKESELLDSSDAEKAICSSKNSFQHSKVINESFIGKHVSNSEKNLIEEAAGDFQISIRVYSEIMMGRLFDILPMVVKSIMVNDLISSILVDMQKAFDDEWLKRLFDEEVNINRERSKLSSYIQVMKDAQKKMNSAI